MKFILFKKTEFPPTSILNPARVGPNGRLQVPVTAEPLKEGWKIETDDPEAAVSAIKDNHFLLLDPPEWQFPAVPNYDGHYKAKDFKFKAATEEEIDLGRYHTFVESKRSEEAKQALEDGKVPDGMTEEEELEMLRKKLTEAGVKFHPATKAPKLRNLVAEIPPPSEG